MTTIHMDIEAMQRIQRNLIEIQGQIQDRIQALRRNYQSLPYNWIGDSANEYFDHYTEFEANVTSVVETLGEIASELAIEIANWESMDNGLGD